MFTIARFTLLETLRSKSIRVVLVVIIVALALSLFAGEIALTESTRIRVAFLAGILRMASALMVSLFLINAIMREFNEKGHVLLLSMAIPRSHYVIGKLLGFSMAAAIISCAATLAIAIFIPATQAIPWGVSLMAELWIIVAFSLFCALAFSHPMPAITTVFGFYVLSRTISTIQLIGHGSLTAPDSPTERWLIHGVDGIALLLPHLDQFTRTSWLVNAMPTSGELMSLGGQALLYVMLLTVAASIDLYRKNL